MKKGKSGKIKALIFDVGGVLYLGDVSPINHKKMISKTGVHPEVAKETNVSLDQYFDSIDSSYSKSVEGQISEEKAIKIMAKNLQTTPERLKKLYMLSYRSHFHLNKELLDYAKKLKKKGFKVAILSDQWYISKKALIGKNFYKTFNPVIVSCDVGLRKPNPKIYRLTLKKLKVKPEESVFIDNQKWNLVPAKKLSMKTIFFKNNKQLIKDLNNILK